jgi:hypothetical protein
MATKYVSAMKSKLGCSLDVTAHLQVPDAIGSLQQRVTGLIGTRKAPEQLKQNGFCFFWSTAADWRQTATGQKRPFTSGGH